MATSSISKQIIVDNDKIASSLADALEKAQKAKPREVVFQKTPRNVDKSEIKKLFRK